MSAARRVSIGTALGLLVTACAPWAPSEPSVVVVEPPTARTEKTADLVLVGTGDGLAVLDWAAGRLVFRAPRALAVPDGSRLVATTGTGEAHSLDVLDARTGTREGSIPVPASLAASVVSTDGRRVALAPARPNGGAWQPPQRDRTQIVVVDPSSAVERRVFDLDGNYEPDAFSTDDQRLFVLEYQPPQAPDRYRVRQLDLATGVITGVASRSKVAVPEEDMRGTRRMHVLSPDRTTLYTLYTHQPDHLHSRDLAAGRTVAPGDVHAFVHVLSLSQGWAYCLGPAATVWPRAGHRPRAGPLA